MLKHRIIGLITGMCVALSMASASASIGAGSEGSFESLSSIQLDFMPVMYTEANGLALVETEKTYTHSSHVGHAEPKLHRTSSAVIVLGNSSAPIVAVTAFNGAYEVGWQRAS